MKNKKKGFTLVELVGVILILSLLISVGTAVFINIRKNTTKRDYDNLVSYLETKAVEYANSTNVTTISVGDLISEGLVTPDDQNYIYSPIDKEIMNCYIIKMTYANGGYTAKLEEKLEDENGNCKEYEKTGMFSICAYNETTGKCSVIGNDQWFKEDVTLGIVYSNSETLISKDEGTFSWSSTNGSYGNEPTIKTDTSLINQSTYQCDVSLSEGTKGTATAKINVDKEAPIIVNIVNDTGWSSTKEVEVIANDKSGSGILGYVFVGENDACGTEYVSSNKKTFTSTGKYKVCVSDKAGNVVEETFEVVNIDTSKPNNPVISASDGKASGEWHTNNFTLSFSGSESGKVSDIIYYFGTSKNSINLMEKSLNVDSSYNKQTVYVKACNLAGICSDVVSYLIKYDSTAPHYVSGGTIGASSISKPTYEDNAGGSGGVTVYTCVTTQSSVDYSDSCFSSLNTYYSSSCGITYYLYSYAIDIAGNRSAIMQHNTYYEACVSYDYDDDDYYWPSGSGSSSSSGSSSGSSSSICDTTCQMKENSEAWWDAQNDTSLTDEERENIQNALHEANKELSTGNTDCGSGCTYDDDWKWKDSDGNPLYEVGKS